MEEGRKREELFDVLLLDHPSCTILVAVVKVLQRCARRPVLGCRVHFPRRLQPHGLGYQRLCSQPGGSITWSRKLPLTHSHGEISNDFNSVGS